VHRIAFLLVAKSQVSVRRYRVRDTPEVNPSTSARIAPQGFELQPVSARILSSQPTCTIFSQGDPADAVFYLQTVMGALLAVGILAGCSQTATKSPDVSDSIRKSLDQAGFKDVTVSQDRDKGIVTLGGQVASENDKSQAESIAKSLAGSRLSQIKLR
jgi:hypothetical protein